MPSALVYLNINYESDDELTAALDELESLGYSPVVEHEYEDDEN